MRGSLTWDQGSEMHLSCRAHPGYRPEDVFSSRPRSPWERGTNENTGGLIREYLPKGTQITTHQPYHRRHRRRTWVDAPEQPWDGSPHAKHTNVYSLLPPLDTKVQHRGPHRAPISAVEGQGSVDRVPVFQAFISRKWCVMVTRLQPREPRTHHRSSQPCWGDAPTGRTH